MPRVLVAHRDSSVLDSLQKRLSNLGHACECTSDPILALEVAVASAPDLIVLSDDFPEMTGAMLLELTRCLLGTRCPPIVYAPAGCGEQLVADISSALPSAYAFGGTAPRRSAA